MLRYLQKKCTIHNIQGKSKSECYSMVAKIYGVIYFKKLVKTSLNVKSLDNGHRTLFYF
jgi:hypothetical protein